jgi:uncharacterized protein YcfL
MIKKITILALVVLSTTTAFVGCSSDDNSSQEQQNSNFSYNINPPTWLHGSWEWLGDGQSHYFMFRADNISTEGLTSNWKDAYQSLSSPNSPHLEKSAKFYDKSISASYYEAEYTVNGKISDNIKIEKITNTSIKITYTYYYEDSTGSGSQTSTEIYNFNNVD